MEHKHQFFDGYPGDSYCVCGRTFEQTFGESKTRVLAGRLFLASGADTEADYYGGAL